MENTLENKAKFFAQYWGQNVLTRPHCGGKKWILGDEVSIQSALSKQGYDYQYFLELKPLSSITDEDLEKISFNFPEGTKDIEFDFLPDNYKFHWKAKKGIKVKEGFLALKDFDYLRSKGYALPWLGLSVEKQIAYGWVKLKTE